MSTTYGGETLSLAAAKATIETYQRENVVAHLWKQGEKVWSAVNRMLAKRGIAARAEGFWPGVAWVFDQPELSAKFFRACYANGLSLYNVSSVTFSHRDEDIAEASTIRTRLRERCVPDLPPIIDMHTHIWGDAQQVGGCGCADRNGGSLRPRSRRRASAVRRYVSVARGNRCGQTPQPRKQCRRDKRMKPMVTVYPRHGTIAVDECVKWMERGFVGLKIWVSIADEPCVFPLIEKMIEYGKPMLIHAMHKSVGQLPLESDPTNIASLAKRYPQAKIIMPHMGGNFIYSCEVIADCPNVWTDPSGTYCETGMVEHAMKVLGADRILFGSDAPVRIS